jgi:predicted TIM-barrel fold metal-dependent hydrolase
MKLSPTAQKLFEAFEDFEIIDAHEHLPPEHVRVEQDVDFATLFAHYTRSDLIAAGMPPRDYDRMHDANLPLDYRWRLFEPFLPHIRHGSYARAAFIAAKEFYGCDDISAQTYTLISERMKEANKPGIYKRILREKCRIRSALTQANRTDYDLDLLIPIMPLDTYAGIRTWQQIQDRARELGQIVNSLDDYLATVRQGLARWKEQGVVGIKMASRPYCEPDRSEAVSCFEKLRSGCEKELADMNPLRDFVTRQMLDMAAQLDLVVAVHAGVWGDFRTLDPTHIIPIVMAHSSTRFDLYHAGMPYVRETAFIGKNFPNIWLNLCWSHIVSPRMACSTLDEWIDIVPMNKIIAFGGDYGKPVEKVYGHLVVARENIASVLGGRVEAGMMKESEAVEIARRWFLTNAVELYRLKA